MEGTFDILRKVMDSDTGKEKTFIQEIRDEEVMCLYRDERYVYIVLNNGKMIRPENKTLKQLSDMLGL